MPPDYTPPTVGATAFTCPRCGVFAQQTWQASAWKIGETTGMRPSSQYQRATCQKCTGESLWCDEVMVWPTSVIGPLPADDMPTDAMSIYEEARRVAPASPRAAAALLRLTVEEVCRAAGCTGKLDEMIDQLVAKGLRRDVTDALDVVRVIGNDAVHAGEIQLHEDTEVVGALFDIVNVIVEQVISEPKRVAGILARLPQQKLDRIDRRHDPKP